MYIVKNTNIDRIFDRNIILSKYYFQGILKVAYYITNAKIMLNFWAHQPLSKELLAISTNAASQRQPAVESQYDNIQSAVVDHLRVLARQHPDTLTHTIKIDDIFGTNLYDFDCLSPNVFTPTGLAFKLAMAGIEPAYPTSKEKNWMCARIVGYLSQQGLSAKYEYEKLIVSWDPSVLECQ